MSTELSFGEWLGDLLRRGGDEAVRQVELADFMGVSQGSVSNWVNGTHRPTRKNCERIAAFFELSPVDVQDRAGHKREGYRILNGGKRTGRGFRSFGIIEVPLRGRVPADLPRWTAAETEGRTVHISSELVFGLRSQDLIAVEVTGDCLAAHFIFDGDIVICERLNDFWSLPQGKIVVVELDNEVTMKVWYWTGPDSAELRDGNGATVATLGQDEIRPVGIARVRIGRVD